MEKYYKISLFTTSNRQGIQGPSRELYAKVSGTREAIKLYEKFGCFRQVKESRREIGHVLEIITKEEFDKATKRNRLKPKLGEPVTGSAPVIT